ncbi:Transmembrane domain-containing protein [Spironucleus salmonicida]|uniref:Transmembrane domain-containing protein n=2 Tax=Spironucleus salmonicida TaxID=348837 RepID=A0A9P8RZW6_9EUKA|nr:Transmembrane domain-containing protein [Spironucleus salmonicida]
MIYYARAAPPENAPSPIATGDAPAAGTVQPARGCTRGSRACAHGPGGAPGGPHPRCERAGHLAVVLAALRAGERAAPRLRRAMRPAVRAQAHPRRPAARRLRGGRPFPTLPEPRGRPLPPAGPGPHRALLRGRVPPRPSTMTVPTEREPTTRCPAHLLPVATPELDARIARSAAVLYRVEAVLWPLALCFGARWLRLPELLPERFPAWVLRAWLSYAVFTLSTVLLHARVERLLPARLNRYVVAAASAGVLLAPLSVAVVCFRAVRFWALPLAFAALMTLVMAPQLTL